MLGNAYAFTPRRLAYMFLKKDYCCLVAIIAIWIKSYIWNDYAYNLTWKLISGAFGFFQSLNSFIMQFKIRHRCGSWCRSFLLLSPIKSADIKVHWNAFEDIAWKHNDKWADRPKLISSTFNENILTLLVLKYCLQLTCIVITRQDYCLLTLYKMVRPKNIHFQ